MKMHQQAIKYYFQKSDCIWHIFLATIDGLEHKMYQSRIHEMCHTFQGLTHFFVLNICCSSFVAGKRFPGHPRWQFSLLVLYSTSNYEFDNSIVTLDLNVQTLNNIQFILDFCPRTTNTAINVAK